MTRIESFVKGIQDNDEAKIEEAVLRLSKSRRVLAPLAFAVGAFVMLFQGLRLLVTNWRLTLVQILPAMWIWLAMFDLKVHTLHGKSFNVLRGPVLIPLGLLIVAITVASFLLNSVFAFAISRPGRPEVRPAVTQARQQPRPMIVSGVVVGLLLAFATLVVTRWGRPWFTISLGIVVGLMMVCYVAIPSRVVGIKAPNQSRRDKLAATAVGGALSVTVCTPPYLLGRLGLLMIGSSTLLVLVLGAVLLAVGVTLQAGATGSVRAIKMSAALSAGGRRHTPTIPGDVSELRRGLDWADGMPSTPQPQIFGVAGDADAGGEPTVRLEDVHGGRLLVTDVRVAMLLLTDARHRVVERLFGVPSDGSWLVTLVALGIITRATRDKADQMLRGPGGPYLSDFALGAFVLRELLVGTAGPSSRGTPLFGTLVTIAVVGALLRPPLTGTARGIEASLHRVRLAFDRRYGHLISRRVPRGPR